MQLRSCIILKRYLRIHSRMYDRSIKDIKVSKSHSHSELKYIDRGCGISRFNLIIQADSAELISDLVELLKKKIRKRKKIDILRSEFT